MLKNEIIKSITNEINGVSLIYKLNKSINKSRAAYGVEIYMQKSGKTVSDVSVNDVFSEESDALKFFDAVCKGAVTPNTLFDITEDWLG